MARPKPRTLLVFNLSRQGNIIARLVEVQPPNFAFNNKSMQMQAIKQVIEMSASWVDADAIIGVSNPLPSGKGAGGASIFPVTVIPPQVPQMRIEIGPSAKTWADFHNNPHLDPTNMNRMNPHPNPESESY